MKLLKKVGDVVMGNTLDKGVKAVKGKRERQAKLFLAICGVVIAVLLIFAKSESVYVARFLDILLNSLEGTL